MSQEVEGKPVMCCCEINVETEASALTKVEVMGNLKSYCSRKLRTDASWSRLNRERDTANSVVI